MPEFHPTPDPVSQRCVPAPARLIQARGGSIGERSRAKFRFQTPGQVIVGTDFKRIQLQADQLDPCGALGSAVVDPTGTMHMRHGTVADCGG